MPAYLDGTYHVVCLSGISHGEIMITTLSNWTVYDTRVDSRAPMCDGRSEKRRERTNYPPRLGDNGLVYFSEGLLINDGEHRA